MFGRGSCFLMRMYGCAGAMTVTTEIPTGWSSCIVDARSMAESREDNQLPFQSAHREAVAHHTFPWTKNPPSFPCAGATLMTGTIQSMTGTHIISAIHTRVAMAFQIGQQLRGKQSPSNMPCCFTSQICVPVIHVISCLKSVSLDEQPDCWLRLGELCSMSFPSCMSYTLMMFLQCSEMRIDG